VPASFFLVLSIVLSLKILECLIKTIPGIKLYLLPEGVNGQNRS
jgi:hypothetical protein